MSQWYVFEQDIYDENGRQIIRASEWNMCKALEDICKEHNTLEQLKARHTNENMVPYAIFEDSALSNFLELFTAYNLDEIINYCKENYREKFQAVPLCSKSCSAGNPSSLTNRVLWHSEMNFCIGLRTEMDRQEFIEEAKRTHLEMTADELQIEECTISHDINQLVWVLELQ